MYETTPHNLVTLCIMLKSQWRVENVYELPEQSLNLREPPSRIEGILAVAFSYTGEKMKIVATASIRFYSNRGSEQ